MAWGVKSKGKKLDISGRVTREQLTRNLDVECELVNDDIKGLGLSNWNAGIVILRRGRL